MIRSTGRLASLLCLASSAALAANARQQPTRLPIPVLGPEAAPFKDLRANGFAVLPPGRFMDKRTQAVFDRAWRALPLPDPKKRVDEGSDPRVFFHNDDSRKGIPHWNTRSKLIIGFVDRLTARLRRALPGEDFFLEYVEIGVARDRVPRAAGPHVDYGRPLHVVVTYPLADAPGSILYKTRGRKTVAVAAPPRSAAILSAVGREIVTGRPAPVHNAYPWKVALRPLLTITYISRNAPWGTENYPKAVAKAVRARVQTVERLLK